MNRAAFLALTFAVFALLAWWLLSMTEQAVSPMEQQTCPGCSAIEFGGGE